MEIIKEVRVPGKEITLKYPLPWLPAIVSKKEKGGQFLTVSKMVEAIGHCKEPLCTLSFRLHKAVRTANTKGRRGSK